MTPQQEQQIARLRREAIEASLALSTAPRWSQEMRRDIACHLMLRSIHRQAAIAGIKFPYSWFNR